MDSLKQRKTTNQIELLRVVFLRFCRAFFFKVAVEASDTFVKSWKDSFRKRSI